MLPIRYIFRSSIPKFRQLGLRRAGAAKFSFLKNHRDLTNTFLVKNIEIPSFYYVLQKTITTKQL